MKITQAFRNAVEAERAASRFYRQLVPKTTSPIAQAFFEDMASKEVQHADEIERRAKECCEELPESASQNVDMVETLTEWLLVDEISFEEALDLAVEAERRAALYYASFAGMFSGSAAEFFVTLAKEEERHAIDLAELRDSLVEL